MVKLPNHLACILKTTSVVGCMSLFAATSVAQDSDAEARYASLLQQIADLNTTIAHKEVYIATQEAEIASLREQISGVDATKDALGPMIEKMTASISDEIDADLPFFVEGRFERLGDLQDALEDQEVGIGEKWRKALNIYNAEVTYGNTMQAHDADHPTNPGTRLAACQDSLNNSACARSEFSKEITELVEGKSSLNELDADDAATVQDYIKDGTYLRYGRLAYVYLQADDSEALRYDPTSKEWVPITGGRALEIRRSVKIAKGEAAPGVVEAPVYVAN